MTAAELAARLEARETGSGCWMAKCPGHEDHRESLSIGTGDDSRVLLKCHAGCTVENIMTAATLTMADLFVTPKKKTTAAKKIVATYNYTDENGQLLYQVVRYEIKNFRQRRPDPAGGWIWNMTGVRRVIYRLPAVRFLPTVARKLPDDVFIPEGEGDVDRLVREGLIATTNVGGAGKWLDDYSQQLVGAGAKSVIVLPDNDEPGRNHAEHVTRSCHAAGLTVKVVMLPNLPEKGDVSDWLQTHTIEDLVTLVTSTPAYVPTTNQQQSPPSSKTALNKSEKPKQGSEVLFEDVEPWPESVNGAALLDSMARTFTRYLALPKHASTALALWVLHAWALDAFFISPILGITSPVKRCGKTLTLIVLGALAPRRMFAANVTPAVLFRTIEKYAPTLLIDEADTFIRDNDELRGVINSGLTRTTAVCIRAVGDDYDPRAFSTWCAKAIALIGKLPGTLEDRSIEVSMRRRTAGEHVARLRQDRIGADCAELRQQAARWTDDHLQVLQRADPDVPNGLHDRAADCWRPLLAIADAAGGRWRELARAAALALSGESSDDDAGTMLLTDIRTIFVAEGNPDVLGSTAIVEKLLAIEDRPWAEWSKGKPLSTAKLARLLKPYGIHTAGDTRIGSKVVNAYRRVVFVEAWERYIPAQAPSQGLKLQQCNKPNEYGGETALSKCNNQDPVLHFESATNPINTESCCTVAISEGGEDDADDLDTF